MSKKGKMSLRKRILKKGRPVHYDKASEVENSQSKKRAKAVPERTKQILRIKMNGLIVTKMEVRIQEPKKKWNKSDEEPLKAKKNY